MGFSRVVRDLGFKSPSGNRNATMCCVAPSLFPMPLSAGKGLPVPGVYIYICVCIRKRKIIEIYNIITLLARTTGTNPTRRFFFFFSNHCVLLATKPIYIHIHYTVHFTINNNYCGGLRDNNHCTVGGL